MRLKAVVLNRPMADMKMSAPPYHSTWVRSKRAAGAEPGSGIAAGCAARNARMAVAWPSGRSPAATALRKSCSVLIPAPPDLRADYAGRVRGAIPHSGRRCNARWFASDDLVLVGQRHRFIRVLTNGGEWHGAG